VTPAVKGHDIWQARALCSRHGDRRNRGQIVLEVQNIELCPFCLNCARHVWREKEIAASRVGQKASNLNSFQRNRRRKAAIVPCGKHSRAMPGRYQPAGDLIDVIFNAALSGKKAWC
jgi:hypothetical protein